MRNALWLILLAACSNSAAPREPTRDPAPPDAAIADAARVVAVPVPVDAAAPPCLPNMSPYTLAFAGAAVEVCWGDSRRCLLVGEDGTISGPAAPVAEDGGPELIEVTIAEDERSVKVCPNGTCVTLAPKLKKGHRIGSADPDRAGRHVMLTVFGGLVGDESDVEIWSVSTGKRIASLRVPYNDAEASAAWAEWVGSLVLMIEEDAPDRDASGTLYVIGKKKLAKVARLSDFVDVIALEDRAVFGADLGATIVIHDLATGRQLQHFDTSWLVSEDDLEGLAFGGLVRVAAAGDRVAILDANDPRIGFLTPSTGAHTTVALPACP